MSDSSSNVPTPPGQNPDDAADRAESKTGSSPDPKLRSFLRQAAAIISAERGLNDITSAKLQLLAQRLALSDETFDKAMRRLKEPKRDLIHLNRYEQSFVDLLKKEMPQIPRRILTIKMEQQLIDIADRKYQINEIRAQQLIQKTAEEINVGTISHADAEHFATQLIVDSIGQLTRIDSELIDRLEKAGRKWGLTDLAVDKIIKRVIAKNRARRRNSRLAKGLVLLIGAALICAIVYAVLTIDWLGLENVAQREKEPTNIELHSDPTVLSWWPDRLKSKIAQWSGNDKQLDYLIKDLAVHESAQRGPKYVALTQSLLSPTRASDLSRERKVDLAAELYYAEPDDKNAAQLVAPLFEAIDAHNDSLPLGKSQVSRAHRANELLGRIRFFPRSDLGNNQQDQRRRQILDDEVVHFFGSNYDKISEYLTETQKALSIDQWYHAIRVAYGSPSRAAVLVPEIEQLSQTVLDKPILEQLRARALRVILETDLSNWEKLEPSITAAIRDSNSSQVDEWISLLLTVDDRRLLDFLSNQLIRRTGLQPASSSRTEKIESLRKHQLQGGRSDLMAMLQRMEDAESLMTRVQRNLELNTREDILSTTKGQEKLPELIAQLVYVTNLMLALEKAIDSDAARTNPFSEYDLLRSEPLPRISPAVSPSRSNISDTRVGGPPTASETRTKIQSIQRLATTDESRIATRKTALKTLAEVSNRFDDIDYADASKLAAYLLGEKTMEEWLAIERTLQRLNHWTTLKLAIADQLPNSSVKMDQALTLVSILAPSENQFDLPGNWRREIKLWLIRDALNHLNASSIEIDSDSTWNQLRKFLAEGYQTRAKFISGSTISNETRDICEPVLQAIRSKIKSDDAVQQTRLGFAIEQVSNREDDEMSRCIMVNQILINWIMDQIQLVSNNSEETSVVIRREYDRLLVDQQNEGTRLYFSEVAILRLSHLLLKRRIEGLVK